MDISLGVVGCLILLVDNGILCGASSAAQASIRVLGDMFVGLLRCLSTTALDSLRDVVDGVLRSDISTLKNKNMLSNNDDANLGGLHDVVVGKVVEKSFEIFRCCFKDLRIV